MSCPKEDKIKRLEHQIAMLRQNVYDLQEQKADMLTVIDGLKEEIFSLMKQSDEQSS